MDRKKFWYLVGFGVLLLFTLLLISNVISVGERLRNVHQYVEYGFYGLSVILTYVLIINPLRIIFFAPTFSVDQILDDEKRRHKVYKDAAKVLLKNDTLTDGDKVRLKEVMNDKSELKQELAQIFNTTMKDGIRAIIEKNSKTVLVSTALSQNGNLDMLSVIVVNIKMIREITELTGFRPSLPRLVKLMINVLTTSLIAEGLDDAEISELLPNKISETLTDLPLVRTISNSVMSGTANALLTCRVGLVTEKYLFNDNELLDKKQIRRMAWKEAMKMMPNIVGGGLAAFPKGVASFFTKPFKKKQKDQDE